MKITNKLNLPETFANFYDNSEDKGIIQNRYSVTELLKPIQEIILFRTNYDKIKRDLTDLVPAIFGSAVHYILEKNTKPSETLLSEYKFETDILGKIVVGKCDLLDLEKLEIIDYKTSSVSKVKIGNFDDYYKQDMIYAYMTYLKFGVKIKRLKNYILMKDWSKLKLYKISDYPTSPIHIWEYEVQDSDFDYIEKWLKQRIRDIDAGIVNCSEEETWYSGNKFAVYKNKGDIRAKKVFDSLTEAELYKVENKFEYIEMRKGENTKCLYYCDCKEFCEQYRKELENGKEQI